MVATVGAAQTPTADFDRDIAWLVGGDFNDDVWEVRTGDYGRHRNGQVRVDFDVPIGLGVRLCGEDAQNDLLTAKTVLKVALSADGRGWITKSSAVKREYLDLLNFFRWRRRQGFRRTSSLTPEIFDLFCEQMLEGGLEGLLQSESQVRKAIECLTQLGCDFILPANLTKCPLYDAQMVIEYAGFESVIQISIGARECLKRHAASLNLSLRHRPAMRRPAEVAREEKEESPLTINARLQIWRRLWLLREELGHDALNFDPFVIETSPYKVARSLTRRKPGRTPTAPPLQTCHLVDRALRWVLVYSDWLTKFGDALRENRDISTNVDPTCLRKAILRETFRQVPTMAAATAGPWPLDVENYFTASKIKGAGLSARDALLELLPGACVIVIAAFSARRGGEISSLKRGCIEIRDGEPWLKSYIEKSDRGVEVLPVPYSVVRAVEILEWLNMEVGEEAGQWLLRAQEFVPSRPGKLRVTNINVNKAIGRFVEYIDIPPMDNGHEWRFTSHQFRRFFAVVYFYRHKFRSLEALTYFLRHDNPDTTLTYVTESHTGGMLGMAEAERMRLLRDEKLRQKSVAGRLQDFKDVGLEFRVERITAVAEGRERIGGFGGARLMRELEAMVEEFKPNVEVVASAAENSMSVNLIIKTLAERTKLDPHPDGHSYCRCDNSANDRAVARCALIAAGQEAGGPERRAPDHRYASDLACAECPHNAQFEENEAYWLELALSEPLSAEASSILSDRLAARRQAARSVLASIVYRKLP